MLGADVTAGNKVFPSVGRTLRAVNPKVLFNGCKERSKEPLLQSLIKKETFATKFAG
jgi:hypothetical protein